jgi:hypothetical protein
VGVQLFDVEVDLPDMELGNVEEDVGFIAGGPALHRRARAGILGSARLPGALGVSSTPRVPVAASARRFLCKLRLGLPAFSFFLRTSFLARLFLAD